MIYKSILGLVFVIYLSINLRFDSTLSLNLNPIPAGDYRIENLADGLHLTIQGVNSSFATVVGDTWRNFKEQKWNLKKMQFTTGYHLMPNKYRSNNIISYHKDPLKKHAQPETWMLKEFNKDGKKTFQIVNERTTYCLMSSGRRREVTELKCDPYQRMQQWSFYKL